MSDDARPPYEPGDLVNVLYLAHDARPVAGGESPPLALAVDRPVVAVLWSPIDGMWHLSVDLPDDAAATWDGHYRVTDMGGSPHVRPADPGDCPSCSRDWLCLFHVTHAVDAVAAELGGTVLGEVAV